MDTHRHTHTRKHAYEYTLDRLYVSFIRVNKCLLNTVRKRVPNQKAEVYIQALHSCNKSAALGVVKDRAANLPGTPCQQENRLGTQQKNATDMHISINHLITPDTEMQGASQNRLFPGYCKSKLTSEPHLYTEQ